MYPQIQKSVKGKKASVLVYCVVAEVAVRGTDYLQRAQSATASKHNERVVRWNTGGVILMDLEHELRALNQARFNTDVKNFDKIEGQAWMNHVFQERMEELEVELFETEALRIEEVTNVPTISTFVPPNLKTRLGSVSAVPQVVQSSSE